ncbi:CPBP family intramembrane glutamic endopeptidase [Thalassomonas actiniarum]|uniref:CPBP family intramembrane metalloprotease n=1 Tax=Thalassomonas actiniarum TaxID=485447 RepID=A0AAF0C626_9GAMM|nr:CPBP family intramembrane glutamic endopeptidase [Thalassomonas actiniarum]WDE01545.1 CPBP family intramembrane metalloprotease [Thalassomonas actiniarum]
MFYQNELQHSGIIWLSLAIAVISAFYSKRLWLVPLALTLVLALFYKHLTFVGAAILLFGFALAKGQQFLAGKLKALVQGLVVIWCLALAAHLLPGFNNLHVLDQVYTGPQSLPFTLYLNLDKPMLFFALLLMLPGLSKPQAIPAGVFQSAGEQHFSFSNPIKPLVMAMLVIGLIFIAAFLLELILFEMSLPEWWWLFVINNLLFTCVAEEAFFRGFVQQKIMEKFSLRFSPKQAATGAVIIASVLFGLAHFAGGASYVLVATLAGVLYGFTYLYTGRLTMAIAVHFLVNMLHLLFFTYPMAKPEMMLI